MSPSPPDGMGPVRDFQGLHYLSKWRETVGFARYKQTDEPGIAARLAAFRRIKDPVFILGSPRSGTTYLGDLLAGLPRSSYFYEPPLLKYQSRRIYQGSLSERGVGFLYSIAFRVLLLAAPGSGPRIIEKNPNHTWIAEQLIRSFPEAKFVMIIRDGRDVATSLAEKPWHRRDQGGENRREPGGYQNGAYPHFYIEPDRRDEYLETSDIHRCAWIWRRHAEEIERLRAILPTAAAYEVRYEQLLRNPDAELTRLLGWLNEADDVSIRAATVAAQAGHVASIGRWRSALTAEEIEAVEAECGQTLRRLGYV